MITLTFAGVVLFILWTRFQISTSLLSLWLLSQVLLMVPCFHCAFFCSSPFMTTTSTILISVPLLLCSKLRPSRNDARYSFLHLFHSTSLHCCIHVCLIWESLFLISVGFWLGITGAWPKTSKFRVKTGNCLSSST